MKRVFFCGVLPSKYSGRWRGCPQFDFAKEKRNSPQTPLPLFLCSNGMETEAVGQKFLLPNPLPFCPPAWASPPKLFGRTDFSADFKFFSLPHPPCAEKFKELPFCLPNFNIFDTIVLSKLIYT